MTMNGDIAANGVNAPTYNAGAGSGGSIYITTKNLQGSGTIEAVGGTSSNGYFGGGGRIAVYYETSTFTGTLSAKGGGFSAENGTVVYEALPTPPQPGNNPPRQPVNILPKNGATVKDGQIILMANAFSDPDIGDYHSASQWQITSDSNDYSNPVFDSGLETNELTEINIPDDLLEYSTKYFWRVRYQDSNGQWSEWSQETSFTIKQIQPPFAYFSISTENPKESEEILLDAEESYAHYGKIETYEWDLNGDGQFEKFQTTSPKIYYYWDETGQYSVILRVTDSIGAQNTYSKDIQVTPKSFWEKIKNPFASIVYELNEQERERYKIIKEELGIANREHSESPDPIFGQYTDNQILTILKAKISPELSSDESMTYETYISDIIHDKRLADAVANRPYAQDDPVINAYFNMEGLNRWAETISIAGIDYLVGRVEYLIGPGVVPIGMDLVFKLPDLIKVGIGLKFIAHTQYQLAIYNYFEFRADGFDPQNAYSMAMPPGLAFLKGKEGTSQYFENLWTQYGDVNIDTYGGLKKDFKDQIREQLRNVLLHGLEEHKFEPYYVFDLNSPGEMYIRDSQGRLTGLVAGNIREEIPESAYDAENRRILIFDVKDTYSCNIIGTENGNYELRITNVDNGKAIVFTSKEIPTNFGTIQQYAIDWSLLSEGKEGATIEVDSNGDGTFEKTITAGYELTHDEFILKTDTTPPQTIINTQGTAGNNGWFTSDVTVTLTATDNPDGSGVASTEFSLDGTTWSTYTNPFTITTEGTTTVSFRSTDNAGNVEETKHQDISIDKMPPVITITSPADGAEYLLNAEVLADYSAECSHSGIALISCSIPDGEKIPTGSIGDQSFTVTATDNAGNEGSAVVKYYVTSPTPVTTVFLKDSQGTGLSDGRVQYYSKGWNDFGVTDNEGKATRDLPPGKYNFRMTFGGASIDKQQDITANPTATFQTVQITAELRDSTGQLMDTGTVQYYAAGWKPFGTTTGGTVKKELLPKNYNFRMDYGSASVDKQQDIMANPTVTFQTMSVMAELRDSTGQLMDSGTVQYYAAGWKPFGITSGGTVKKELLPKNYNFRMAYESASNDKAQDVGTNPVITFQTTSVTAELRDSTGQLMDIGTVQYYAAGWKPFGITSGGTVSKELLPGNYNFRMGYGSASIDKQQDITANPTVTFQTVQVTAELRDSAGQPMDTGMVQYYAAGWKPFGTTSAGMASKELLPGTYNFRMVFGGGSDDEQQDIIVNPMVVFQTGKVVSDSGSCTGYYAGGWKSFMSDMELLPLTYTFRFNDGTPDSQYGIQAGQQNHIH